jgi:hypothetical protein
MKLRCSAGLELTPRQPVASGFRAGDGPVNRAEVCAMIVLTFGMMSRAASAAPQAPLSGSNPKAPGFAGGYLPFAAPPAALAKIYRGLAFQTIVKLGRKTPAAACQADAMPNIEFARWLIIRRGCAQLRDRSSTH